MKIHYHVERLERILKDLSTLTGIAIGFLDTEGKGVCQGNNQNDYCEAIHKQQQGERRCYRSDQLLLERCRRTLHLESHICYAGLYDAAMPIVKRGHIVGFIIMGRVRYAEQDVGESRPKDEALCQMYESVPMLTAAQIDSLRTLLPNILFESAIELDAQELIDQATDYVERHLHEDLSLGQLCAKLHVSKNRLYEAFHQHHRCTVNEYVSAARLGRACELLVKGDDTVYQIAEQVGMDNYTYFCKWFKKQTGQTPSEYRREQRAVSAQ